MECENCGAMVFYDELDGWYYCPECEHALQEDPFWEYEDFDRINEYDY